ncbi:major capsid protein [Pacmanvirus S19]|nr:major capsid protein [Pacmanvirus S19]
MSAGGVFKLIANDGKADRMIMATELLNSRIKDIMCMRAKQGFPDPTPTLVDIERTHILFVNAHFKPFAAIGYEYNKVRANTGTPQFGGSVQFSIPQFGDFFNDMVVHVQLAATSATAGTVPALPAYIGTSNQSVSSTQKVSATVDETSGVYTKYTHEYVDLAGTVKAVGAAASNFVRYAEYPGQRLFKKVKFEVNGNPLDEYTAEAYMYHQKFCVQPGKMTGWMRLVGQEVPVDAYSSLVSVSGASNFPAAVAGLEDVNGDAAEGAPTNASVTARKVARVVSGAQTPKATQPALDLWVPLIFWFNKDPRLSIASVSIPYGQRFITIDIEQQSNVLFTAPGNLFLKLTVEQQTSAGTGKGTAAAQAVEDVKKWVTLTPVLATGSTIDTTQQISLMELYINNIFVNPEIHDIYIKRIGFSLIRVHRFQSTRTAVSSDNILLSQLKWPIETMCVGLRPAVNISASNTNQYRDWHRLTLLTDNVIETASKSHSDVMIDDTVAFNATSAKHKTSYSMESAERLVFPSFTETIDTLQLQAHGINIFSTFAAQFFRDYMSYTFGGANVITPEDLGAYMLNFCLYPGTYQPSGHINVSRAREFYLQFASSYCTSSTPCDLLVLAKAINFLLILNQIWDQTVSCLHSCQITMSDKQCKFDRYIKPSRGLYNVYNLLVSSATAA